MPGLNQLKQFSEDVLNLGDEIKLRAARGEKPVTVAVPENVSDRDDSEDFVLGIPQKNDDEEPPEEISNPEVASDSENGISPEPETSEEIPDIDSLLASIQDTAPETDTGDLSDFLESSDIPDVQTGTGESGNTEQNPKNVETDTESDQSEAEELFPEPTETTTESTGIPESAPQSADDFNFDGDAIDLSDGFPEELKESGIPGSSPATAQESTLSPQPPKSDLVEEQEDSEVSPESTEQPETAESLDKPESGNSESSQDAVTFDDIDTSGMDGVDFNDHPASSGITESVVPDIPDFDIPDTDEKIASAESDFELDKFGAEPETDFEIPGFSDTDTAIEKAENLQTPDFTGAVQSGKTTKNELTDAEYKKFRKNLEQYPLNVRVAVENLIVKNEFTDDAVFEVIRNIIKKLPARQVASQLEKMLDISLNVPRDYERRTAAEYEIYKSSLQYQLRNRIIPGAIIGICALIIGIGLFMAGKRYVYKPLMAGKLYKEGYVLLQTDEYPQSEQKFKEALSYEAKKKWFFKYAEGYRDHKQFNRAESMYQNILNLFNFDKQAGLEYAQMESNDLVNYKKAVQILKRDVLDHFINDKAGLLQLGDTYLAWGSEEDPAQLENAREQYSILIQLYGSNNLYLSRMMRYFIRTDNLREVLNLKNIFFPNKKSLSAQDWTELSGYMLDKLYAPLPPADEYLREYIEDIREMLQRAVDADPQNSVAHYNFGRYFIHRNNDRLAKLSLEESLKLFESAPRRTQKSMYQQINAYRLLGELYGRDQEYIKSSELYTKGIDLFEGEQKSTGFPGTEEVGKLYADMGNLSYFISGDMDSAYRNYSKSIENKNDTPSIRYHIGYIQYGKKNYLGAWGSFVKASGDRLDDNNLLLALGNVLSLRDDNIAAQGYYENLLSNLESEMTRKSILLPQVNEEDGSLVDFYMKASNNLGVTLYRLANQTGNSSLNAEAIVRFSESMRAWDALTRNQKTMVRLQGSNLAQQNTTYITYPQPPYKPAIYTTIPRTLSDEKGLQ